MLNIQQGLNIRGATTVVLLAGFPTEHGIPLVHENMPKPCSASLQEFEISPINLTSIHNTMEGRLLNLRGIKPRLLRLGRRELRVSKGSEI